MRHIVGPEWVLAKTEDSGTVFIDCRFVLGEPQAGYDAYLAGHIPGAHYVDLEQDLSAPVREDGVGGRHPLPDVEAFTATLTRLGISRNSTVVAYDDQGGAMASRLWWLLVYMGHDDVFVMDGGFSAWKQAGYPVVAGKGDAAGKAEAAGEPFVANVREEMVATASDILSLKKKIESGRVILMDSRENARYRGIAEPIDKAAGHIPGAKNWFWKANLDAEGRFRSIREQMERFEPLQGAEEIIVYCGSGVTACPNVIALREAGFPNVRLYAGSWSDWISSPDRPIATSEE